VVVIHYTSLDSLLTIPPKSAVSVHILEYITPDDSKFQIVICKFYFSEKDFGVKIM
jgi:hypothetical protein